jgi:hypothetical protein
LTNGALSVNASRSLINKSAISENFNFNTGEGTLGEEILTLETPMQANMLRQQ